jgi:hypothetical protein
MDAVPLDMNTHQINNVVDPSLAQDAATKNYVDTELAGIDLSAYLQLAGGTMTGALNMGTHLISGVVDPSSAQDAATKNYVDGLTYINTLLGGTEDLDTITTTGVYRLQGGHSNIPTGADYGQMLVMHAASDTITQIIGDYSGNLWYRNGNPTDVGGSGSWQSWRQVITDADVDVANGVATLGSDGDIYAQGSDLHLVRDTGDRVRIRDRTSGENFMVFDRNSADEVECWIPQGGSNRYVLTEYNWRTYLDIGIADIASVALVSGTDDAMYTDATVYSTTTYGSYVSLNVWTVGAFTNLDSIDSFTISVTVKLNYDNPGGLRVYKNGVQVASNTGTYTGSYTTKNLTVSESLSPGDTIDVRGYSYNERTFSLKDFTINGTIVFGTQSSVAATP